jgi:hypothetical protein
MFIAMNRFKVIKGSEAFRAVVIPGMRRTCTYIVPCESASTNATCSPLLSRDHISRAARIFVQRLQAQQEASEQEMRRRRPRRIR